MRDKFTGAKGLSFLTGIVYKCYLFHEMRSLMQGTDHFGHDVEEVIVWNDVIRMVNRVPSHPDFSEEDLEIMSRSVFFVEEDYR